MQKNNNILKKTIFDKKINLAISNFYIIENNLKNINSYTMEEIAFNFIKSIYSLESESTKSYFLEAKRIVNLLKNNRSQVKNKEIENFYKGIYNSNKSPVCGDTCAIFAMANLIMSFHSEKQGQQFNNQNYYVSWGITYFIDCFDSRTRQEVVLHAIDKINEIKLKALDDNPCEDPILLDQAYCCINDNFYLVGYKDKFHGMVKVMDKIFTDLEEAKKYAAVEAENLDQNVLIFMVDIDNITNYIEIK